jgi:hypothetical protein
MINTSQDPDYFGPTGHEKKFHKTHFWGALGGEWKSLRDDPEYEEYAPGKFRKLNEKRRQRRRDVEVTVGE